MTSEQFSRLENMLQDVLDTLDKRERQVDMLQKRVEMIDKRLQEVLERKTPETVKIDLDWGRRQREDRDAWLRDTAPLMPRRTIRETLLREPVRIPPSYGSGITARAGTAHDDMVAAMAMTTAQTAMTTFAPIEAGEQVRGAYEPGTFDQEIRLYNGNRADVVMLDSVDNGSEDPAEGTAP